MRTWKIANPHKKLYNAVCYMYIALHYIVFSAHRTSPDRTPLVFITQCTEFQSWLCC